MNALPAPYPGQAASLDDAYLAVFTRYQGLIRRHIHVLEDVVGQGTAQRALRRCDRALENLSAVSELERQQWIGFCQGLFAATRVMDLDREAQALAAWWATVPAPSDARNDRIAAYLGQAAWVVLSRKLEPTPEDLIALNQRLDATWEALNAQEQEIARAAASRLGASVIRA